MTTEYQALLDALFFSVNKPVNLDQIMKTIELENKNQARKIVDNYIKNFNDFHSGVKIISVKKGNYVLFIESKYVDRIKSYIKPSPLTQKQLRTLSYILKHQPVEQNELSRLFGSRIYNDIKKLGKMGMITKKKKENKIIIKIKEEAKYLIKTN